MREIDTEKIYGTLKRMILTTLVETTEEAYTLLKRAQQHESSPAAAFALDIILKNVEIAKSTRRPLCQDTGMAIVFLEIGQAVHLTGALITDQINRAVQDAYQEGYFRMSVLDPITRENTKTNTPAIIHTEIIAGDTVTVRFLPKGFGSENMTKTYMLTPAAGIEGIKNAVLDCVASASSSPCPPIVVGVGIGGTLDKAAELSKRALLRPVGTPSADLFLADMEQELLTKINALDIGVQGFGGNNTALAVAIEKFPTHIAGLPVCVSLQCHSIRCQSATI